MSVNRRGLLLGLGGAAATGAGTLAFYRYLLPATESGLYVNLIGPKGYKGTPRPGHQDAFKMVLWDIEQDQVTTIPVPFHVHSVTYDPNTQTFLGMQKWRQQMFSLDRKTQKVTKVLTHPKTRQCIGHGVLHPREPLIYVSEALYPQELARTAEGRIALRDTQQLKLQKEFPSQGENPHDIRLLKQGHVLVVCNQGTVKRYKPTRSNIAFLDRERGTLLHKLDCPHPSHNFAHMDVLSETEVIAVTKNKSRTKPSKNNFIVKASLKGPLEVFDNGAASGTTLDEILSVAVDKKRRVVGATNPNGKQVLFWDVDKKRLIKAIPGFSKPLGISLTYDHKFYVVSDLLRGTALIDAGTLKPASSLLPTHIQKSHFTLAHSLIVSQS